MSATPAPRYVAPSAGTGRHLAAQPVRDLGIDTAAEVRSVLFGGAHGQDHGVNTPGRQCADFLPGQAVPVGDSQNTLSTSSLTDTMRTMFR